MSRYINIDDVGLRKTIAVGGLSAKALWKRIQQEPSIDIVFCKDCKWGEVVRNHSIGFCENQCGVRSAITESSYCSYGEREDE